MFLIRWAKYLGLWQEESPPPDPRLDKMNQMLTQADRLSRLVANGNWAGRRANWRTKKLTSVHPHIYSLIHTVRSTTNAVIARSKPTVETRLSRRHLDNLHTVTLDDYLVDDKGMGVAPLVIMRELLTSITDLVGNIRKTKEDEEYYDYYLRQCTNLFDELEIIIKTYL